MKSLFAASVTVAIGLFALTGAAFAKGPVALEVSGGAIEEPVRIEGEVQLDALYAVIRDLKGGQISEANAIQCLEPSRHWVWTAIDPVSKLLLAIAVGPRTLGMAQHVVCTMSSVC
jgi:hypothetical protein